MATTWSGKVDAKAEAGVKTGFTVKKGDAISIAASGWISYGPSDTYQVGPQGMDGYTRDTLVYPKAWGGALLVDLGGTLYPIGSGKLGWQAPADGELVFLINDDKGRYGDNSGAFEVTVKSADANAGSGAQSWSGNVPATSEAGQSTGLTVEPSQAYSIQASGSAQFAPGQAHGPDGVPNSAGDNLLVCPQANHGELLAKVAGKYYIIGSSAPKWSPDAAGELLFMINDRSGAYGDNIGGYAVTVAPLVKQWSGKVPATQAKPGLATGITLKKGDLLSLVASGFVKLDKKDGTHALGPQGVQGDKAKGGALIMTIGGQTYPAYTGMLDWPVPADGALSLFVQDDYYPDNTGAFDIALQVKPAA